MKAAALILLLFATQGFAGESPCSASVTTPDVQFTLALKDHGAVFQAGEIIPLTLSFTSAIKDRYHADIRNYDRSGRLGIEFYCVQPDAPDPLESYFRVGGFFGGGLGSERVLDTTPLIAEAQLNEWRSLAPGHYRVFAVSSRVWRKPDPPEQTPYTRISETVRSNSIEIDVSSPDPAWQSRQLQDALQPLAARTLRFLNTKDSTMALARLFVGLNQQQPGGWDLMLGLYGSPYRQLAIDSMHAELSAPDHAITNEFLDALVNLQITAEAPSKPSTNPTDPEEAKVYWQRRRTHQLEVLKAEIQTAIAALPRKTGVARAVTLHGLMTAGGTDDALVQIIRPALIAAWNDLPRDAQWDLIESRWPLIAGPQMLPILRRMAAEPPAPNGTRYSMSRETM